MVRLARSTTSSALLKGMILITGPKISSPGDLHVVVHIGDYGGLYEIGAISNAVAAANQLGPSECKMRPVLCKLYCIVYHLDNDDDGSPALCLVLLLGGFVGLPGQETPAKFVWAGPISADPFKTLPFEADHSTEPALLW